VHTGKVCQTLPMVSFLTARVALPEARAVKRAD